MKNQKIYMEHANVTVKSIDKSVAFFQTAFPHFVKRGSGESPRKWVHLGDDVTYLALSEDSENETPAKDYSRNGVNHIGFVVENVDSIAQRLTGAGYKRSYPKTMHDFRIREYFYDADGNEFEFVEYLTEVTSERNSYTPDF